MAGKKKGAPTAVQPFSSPKLPANAAVKAKSPLQQVTNASAPSPKPLATITEAKVKENGKVLKAENNISNIDRLKRLDIKIEALNSVVLANLPKADQGKKLEAKIEALNSVVLANLPRADQAKKLDSKFDILESKIDKIEALLRTVLLSLEAPQNVERIEVTKELSSDKENDNALLGKAGEKDTDSCNSHVDDVDDVALASAATNVSANLSSLSNLNIPGYVPIPPKLLRLFVTSMLFVDYLQAPSDGHVEMVSLAPSRSNVQKDYRRDLQDKLAYLCDRSKGGTTITAIGFEKKDGMVVIHAASNCSKKCDHVPSFLKKTVYLLSAINQDNKKAIEEDILDDAIRLASTKENARLVWYAEALNRCILKERSSPSWINSGMLSRNSNNTTDVGRKDSSIFIWLQSMLPKIKSRAWKDLVDYCYEGRKDMFARIQNMKTASSSEEQDKELILHKIGRIGAHRHATAVICNAAALMNSELTTSWLAGAEIKFHNSPPQVKCHLNTQEDGEEASLYEAALVIFKGEPDLSQYSDDLQFLSSKWGLDMKLGNKLKKNKIFPTKVHAELVLIEHFDALGLSYYDNDKYIGCSKPACYLCFQYIQAKNRVYQNAGKSLLVEPATHNNIYTEWRSPDIALGSKNLETRTRQRNEVLGTMTSRNIATIKKHLQEKCGHRRKQVPDSTNGESVATDFSRMMHKLALKTDQGSRNDCDSVIVLDSDQDHEVDRSDGVPETQNADESEFEDLAPLSFESDSSEHFKEDQDCKKIGYNSQDRSTSILGSKEAAVVLDTQKPLSSGANDIEIQNLKTETRREPQATQTLVENSPNARNDVIDGCEVGLEDSSVASEEFADTDIVEVQVKREMEGSGMAWVLGYFRGLKSGLEK